MKKLLIVDDSSIMRHTIQSFMQELEVEIVGTAADGKQAIAMFTEHLPDLVTLDITMPEVDGLTALGEMLKIKPEARVVIVSALNDKGTALSAISKGAMAFVAKPFTPAKLREAVTKAMGAQK